MLAHLVRIDSNKTHGWQVRFSASPDDSGYHSKLFSDRGLGGKRRAKSAASEYLNQLLEDEGIEEFPIGRKQGLMFPEDRERTSAHNSSGRTGVYRSQATRTLPSGTRIVQHYWAASYTVGPDGRKKRGSKSFYFGTVRTEDEAHELALRFRVGWEEAYLDGGARAVRRFFKEWQERA